MKRIGLSKIQLSMLFLNLFIFVGICWTFYLCTDVIAQEKLAKVFLMNTSFAPVPPKTILSTFMIVFSIYSFNILLRGNWEYMQKNQALFILSCSVDIILCMVLIITTNVIYRGIILLSACWMLYLIESRKQIVLISLILGALYVACDYQILSMIFNMAPYSAYMNFLPANVSSNIYTMQHVFFSINDMIFIIFLFFWVQEQKKEKTIINDLYKRQYKINEELKLANIQLEHYMVQAEENALVRERNRLAREIHDTLGHSLTAISAGLDACVELQNSHSPKLVEQLEILSGISRDTLVDVRRSVRQLRPDLLSKKTLTEAVRKMADNISNITNTNVSFEATGKSRLTLMQEETLFHVIQEAITNSVKHGNAEQIDIALDFDENKVHLIVNDNGVGCEQVIEGTGLSGIRERIDSISGTVSYYSDNGFTLEVHISDLGD